MKLVTIIAFCSFFFKKWECLSIVVKADLQTLEEAELYIASSLNDRNMLECTLKLICETSGMNQSDFAFLVGFGEMAKIFNQLEENHQTQFTHIQRITNAMQLPGTKCGNHYNTCIYSGNESEVFEEILIENQGKPRFPRQAEGPYNPNNSKDDFNITAEIMEEVEEEDGSGFTSKIKGFYDSAKDSLFGFSKDVKESITGVGEKAKDNCDKIKEYTKIIGCPAGQIGCGVLGLFSGGVPGLGCSATLSAACAATHFGVECKEKQEMSK